MRDRPLVSIIVPSFNQGRYIRETLDSCLGQSYRPLEVIVIDGGSTDATVSILGAYGAEELSWISEPDRGVVDAVNKGLKRVSGQYITIQSSDDLFLPSAIEAAVAALSNNPSAGLAFGDVELIDSDSRSLGFDVQGQFDLCAYLGRFMYIPQPGTLFTRAAMEAVGGWCDDVSYVADADYWIRIASRFPVVKVDRIVGRYRYHDEQRDKHRQRIARDWSRCIAAQLDAGAWLARERRFARMGVHLANYRYAAPEAWGLRTLSLYKALLQNPLALLDRRFPKRELLPGRDPVWRFMSRIKRGLGFAPRGAGG